MKRQHALAATAATTMTMLLTGCIDNGYDLTDIDTTSEIKVNDLTLPVNLAPVTLSDIIAVGENEDDKVKEVTINGKTFYAVEETGSFSSDPLRIDPFSAAPDPIYPTSAEFELTGPPGPKVAAAPPRTRRPTPSPHRWKRSSTTAPTASTRQSIP